MNKLEVFFVRHGETEWNKEGRLQGRLDSPLTRKGRETAERLSHEIKSLNFQAVYSSPSGRALETARILTNNQIEIKTDPRLYEIQLGNWQGCLITNLLKEDQERYFAYCEKPEIYEPDDGETFEEVSERMVDFLQFCMREHKEGPILVVSHGVAIRSLILKVQKLPVKEIWNIGEIEGVSVTKLVIKCNEINIEYIGKSLLNIYKIE